MTSCQGTLHIISRGGHMKQESTFPHGSLRRSHFETESDQQRHKYSSAGGAVDDCYSGENVRPVLQ